MERRDTNTELNNLVIELRQLKIQHGQISNRIDQIIDRVIAVQRKNNQADNSERIKREDSNSSGSSNATPRSRKLKLAEGDRVTLKNPEKGRPDNGVVVGFTRTGFVRIDLGDGKKLVRRLSFNLTHHE